MLNNQRQQDNNRAGDSQQAPADKSQISPPAISLPKGGGAIRGIGEKFAANPVTGTGSLTVPIATSPGRSGFGPQLALAYDSGAGNGPFGFGWNLSLPAITRKTDKGLPQYQDADESDVFILSGAEDLVPVLQPDGSRFEDPTTAPGYTIHRYRPRIEGLFARIERWTNQATGEIYWRSITRDNITTIYGKDNNSRIFDPNDPNLDLADPLKPPTRIFSWLICESYDDKGNAIVYEYEEENSDGVDLSQTHERNRTPASRSANRYLKRIKYGNRTPHQPGEDLLLRSDWLFEVVFDYGEHYREDDQGQPTEVLLDDNQHPWEIRLDPFSSYRAGFEVRTYRLCQRVLMFHHFPDELDTADCLVRSTEFTYTESPIAAFITKVIQAGYVYQKSDGTYLKKSLPPLEFEYSQADIQDEIQEIDAESLENLPNGLDGTRYQWVDLDGEGLSGILTEQGDAWFYKPNLGGGELGPLELVAAKPSLAALSSGGQQLMDLAGDGQLDLVELSSPAPGFYERTHDRRWEQFTPFVSLPNLTWGDPNLKLVDLTGDGHADVLISEDQVFTWYPSLAEAGFGQAETVRQALDEEKGPRLIFADGTQSIYLADLSGDGLTDLVRLRNGQVCYWPNLGYGRFGAKVTMDNAPWFDSPDLFDQRRLHLADIDGTGTTDIIYLGRDAVHLYFNQAGNNWSAGRTLNQFPQADNLSAVTVVDLLGNGTACLVWSSPLPDDTRRPMRYVDLMGGHKPHLLVTVKNNLGAETRVQYAPSTKFYLADKLAGKPWITKIPFPVHVVERVETHDHISGNRFVTRYAYHHGYFDGIEREFRGFGLVEQWDTEEIGQIMPEDTGSTATNLDEASFIPPVWTKTWFHTGAYLNGHRISRHFEDEYYRESDLSQGVPGLTDTQLRALLLDDTVLPDTIRLADGTRVPFALSAEEAREACRALKGSILRQEIYALDGTEEEDRPYSVSERNYTVELLQPQGPNQHAVFFTHARETINFHYERKLYKTEGSTIVDPDAASPDALDLADPRVSHAMTLAVDEYGNVLQSVAIGYGRRYDDPDPLLTDEDRNKQKRTLITYTENHYTNPILEDDGYRTPLPCESRTYQLLNVTAVANLPLVTNLFRFDEMLNKIQAANDGYHDLPYEDIDATGAHADHPYRRLIERVRTLYRQNDLTGPLPRGRLESLALPFESYKLAFTPGLLNLYAEKIALADLQTILQDEGRYVDLDRDEHWWIPSGQIFYSPNEGDTPAQELAYARQHFFLPHQTRDPFEETTTVRYDKHVFLLLESEDPLHNKVTVGERDDAGTITNKNDYRVLQPALVTDPNGNRSQVKFDTLGLVVGSAVMGKVGQDLGDLLDDTFRPDLDQQAIDDFFDDPKGPVAARLLGSATTRIIYDLRRFASSGQPVYAATLARETHLSDPPPTDELKIQVSFSYSDGFGREIQQKIQAEPGPAPAPDALGVLRCDQNLQPTDPRWVGTGRTIFNNKGKPVKKYEPFFSPTHAYETEKKLVECGVTPIMLYDPLTRVVATLHPNHTYEKVVFDPWRQETWDVNDTVLQADPKNDPDVADFFRRLPDGDYLPTWHSQRAAGDLGGAEQVAASKAETHANTPTVAYFDTLGRPFLTTAHNRFQRNGSTVEEKYETRVELDIEGNQRAVIDALGRTVMAYDYDMLGNRIKQVSMDAGTRWMLNNVAGKPIYGWDSRGHTINIEYDELQRPIRLKVQPESGDAFLAERTVYGDSRDSDLTLAQTQAANLRGQIYQQYDGAGVVTNEPYDFKGNLLHSSRKLLENSREQVNWLSSPALEDETFTSSTTYDALNRPVTSTTPDKSVIRPTYNEANLLEQVDVNLRGAATATAFVTNIAYNAKGQRELIEYSIKDNAGTPQVVRTDYTYDRETFRLTHLTTTRTTDGKQLQNLSYTYDPVGNITAIRDEAQQTVFFDNVRVEPHGLYEYDALYRLIRAEGREHAVQNNVQRDATDFEPIIGIPFPNSPEALQRYTEEYVYDEVGNILSMRHIGGAVNRWTRRYEYATDSNRLLSTSLPGDPVDGPFSAVYDYDEHGNMTRMPHLPLMRWDYQDQLQASSQQVVTNGGIPEITYYVYDAAGQRVRKVTERSVTAQQLAAGQKPTRKNERLYLGGFEVYREYGPDGSTVELERETLHIMDDQKRVALVETKTLDTQSPIPNPQSLIRYQLDNHLGSACVETYENGQVISYEEYHPYGTTAYQAGRTAVEVTMKRYRYTGKERDDDTGLYYHGARYYAPWLARWANYDPIGLADGVNMYCSMQNNPLRFFDQSGTTVELGYHAETNEAAERGQAMRSSDVAEAQLIAIQRFLRAVGDAQARELGLEGTAAERFARAEFQAVELRDGRLHVDLASARSDRGQGESWVLRRLWELTQAEEVVEVATVGTIRTFHGERALGATRSKRAVAVLRHGNDEQRILTMAKTQNRLRPRYPPHPSLPDNIIVTPDLSPRADPNYMGSRLDLGETFVHELVIHAWRDAFVRAERRIPAQPENFPVTNSRVGHKAYRHTIKPVQSREPEENVHSQADLDADLLEFYALGSRQLERPLSTRAVSRLGGAMGHNVERLREGAVRREQARRVRRSR